jgi:hypothetical protein
MSEIAVAEPALGASVEVDSVVVDLVVVGVSVVVSFVVLLVVVGSSVVVSLVAWVVDSVAGVLGALDSAVVVSVVVSTNLAVEETAGRALLLTISDDSVTAGASVASRTGFTVVVNTFENRSPHASQVTAQTFLTPTL